MEEVFKVAIRNLAHHKLRTGLTLLGIIIGIGAIVALVALGGALTGSIEKQFEQLGSNRIIVSPKMSVGFGAPTGSAVQLRDRDVATVQNVMGVKFAIPILFKTLPVEYNNVKTTLFVMGLPLSEASKFFSDVQGYQIDQGRVLKTGESSSVVIGAKVAKDVFGKEIRLRTTLNIFGNDVKVVGILKATGNTQDDDAVLMDISYLQEITNSSDQISFVFGTVYSDPAGTAQRVQDTLNKVYKDDVFSVTTVEQLSRQIASIFGIISIVLLGIASISLLVAGIGIMNTMLMSVIERTREIGVMKAIGATNNRILLLFLTESAFVGIIGGAVGVVLGYLFANAFATIGSAIIGSVMVITIDPILVVGAIAFSAVVGVVSGTYPAYRASRLDPVDALRYE